MVATFGIFIGDQRTASWGTQPFGDHQEYSCFASPSLPSPPFLPCHHSLLTLHASFLLPDRLCSNQFLFGFGFEMLRGQKTEMSKHRGSVSSFNRILQFHFNLKKLQDSVVVVQFSLAAKFITPTSVDKVLDSISLQKRKSQVMLFLSLCGVLFRQ